MPPIAMGEFLAVITVLVNIGGLAWGAGKMSQATENLKTISERLIKDVNDHEKRLSYIEGASSVH